MDFSKLDTRKGGETASPLHLRWQHNGNLIVSPEGEPALVYVLGSQARSVHNNIMIEARAKMGEVDKGDEKEDRDKLLADLQEMLVAGSARVITTFEGIDWEGELITTEAMKLKFLDLNFISIPSLTANAAFDEDGKWLKPSFAQQVLIHSNEVSNFLDKELLVLSSQRRSGAGSTASRKGKR